MPSAVGLPSVPADAPDRFGGDASVTGGPCLVEPEDDALFPQNWLRPRFRLVPSEAAAQHLFEIRVHAPSEANELVVYTTEASWTMPEKMWRGLATHAVDESISVSVRSAELLENGSTLSARSGSTSSFRIAPSSAPGSIVYWATTHGSALRAFAAGDETTSSILEPDQANGKCLGCHSLTPDGAYAAFMLSDDAINGQPARLGLRSIDGTAAEPPFLSDAARQLLARERQNVPTFSAGHFATGDRVVLSTLNGDLIWTDLEATAPDAGVGWGVLARSGDARQPAGLAWSHDGSRVVYVASSATWETATLDGDLMAVPYADRSGGAASPILGASDPAYNEFYPALSDDDRLLTFDRVAGGAQGDNNAASELFVVPLAGGKATRLRANDPATCQPQRSPGVSNTMARWAPAAVTVGDKTYYWLMFSSIRNGIELPQLYLTSVVLDRGDLSTHAALYLWNQPSDEGNHSPDWVADDLPSLAP